MIFHAEDDWLITQERSKELIEICRRKRPYHFPSVSLIELQKHHGLGHGKIFTHKEIYPIVKYG